MNTATIETWFEQNQQYLSLALDQVRQALMNVNAEQSNSLHLRTDYEQDNSAASSRNIDKQALLLDKIAAQMSTPPALMALAELFSLSRFEHDLLLMCAGMELDGAFSAHCAAADTNAQRPYPTFGLAMATLPFASWDAIIPDGALRRWRLIDIGHGDTLMSSPLRIDERVLHYIAGLDYVDERIKSFVKPIQGSNNLSPSQQQLASQLVDVWSEGAKAGNWPVIQLCGKEVISKHDITSVACTSLGANCYVMQVNDIPTNTIERESMILLWQREIVLSRNVLVLDCEDNNSTEQIMKIYSFIENIKGPIIINRREPLHNQKCSILRLTVNKPDSEEQQNLWQQGLEPFANKLNGELDKVVEQFNLGPSAIQAVSLEVLSNPRSGQNVNETGKLLWQACRNQARPGLDDLAQRIEPMAGWDDLILPDAQKQTLRQAAAHVRQRRQVYKHWGFASKSNRGLGISALLAGASGTGKTMAAEVLAGELELDLYRIDLSSVVSKYIGETEKNLRRVFDAAEEGSAILLFDEADALFGKRSEVKDSHDRYANIEVSYLLQRMETYAGLSILTTNLKSALDTAFLRRIRFVIQFPFPDAVQRSEIWRRIYPTTMPTQDLEIEKLARLNITGGNIRNIAMNAAFLAAEESMPVSMKHLLSATRSEYVKLEKPLTDNEIASWVTHSTELETGVGRR